MKVLTFTREQLEEASFTLAKKVLDSKYYPMIIIGIATGGVYISRPIKGKFIENNWNGKYYEIKLSRKSTETKKKFQIKNILTKLPYFLLNRLRMLEVCIFETLKSKKYDPSKEDNIILSEDLIEAIKSVDTILLIDDAIDTGSTILAIKNVIREINPNIDMKVAILTVTHNKPYVEPEYTLYRRVLIRCPWAEDYKGEDKIG